MITYMKCRVYIAQDYTILIYNVYVIDIYYGSLMHSICLYYYIVDGNIKCVSFPLSIKVL